MRNVLGVLATLSRGVRANAAVCVCLLVCFATAAFAQESVEQLTNFEIGVGSPPALDDAGTTVYSGVPTNQFGGNPDNKVQIFAYNATLTATASQKTNLFHGVEALNLGFVISPLIAVSDDNLWLAFVSSSDPFGTNRDLSPEVFVIKTDGTQLAQLTNDPKPNSGTVSWMAFAGSGNRVAFASNSDYLATNPGNAETLFVVNADGTGLAQLISPPASSFAGLSISDDGTRIAFSTTADLGDFDSDGTTDNPDGSQEIFAILWDGTGLDQLTKDPAFDSIVPDISGDGSTITFQSNANLDVSNPKNQDEIFVMDWGGANLDHLTDTKVNVPGGVGFALAPSITDDGQVIYFFSNYSFGGLNSDNNSEIFKVNDDGSGFTQVTDTIFSDGAFFPRVSGDGSRLAFYSVHDFDGTNNQDFSLEIFAAAGDGTGVVQLTIGEQGSNAGLDMTPDSATIVFASNLDPLGTDPDRGGELYKINVDGTGLTQVTNMFTGNVYEPSISADGTKIAFLAEADVDGTNSDGSQEVHFIKSDGTGILRLTDTIGNNQVAHPDISSDGSQIFYASTENYGGNPNKNREIWRILNDGTGRIQLTEDVAAGRRSQAPRADGAGESVVFESNGDLDGDGTLGWQEIWRVKSDATMLTKVFGVPGFDATEPDISSDGTLIVFSSNADPFGTNPENNSELFRHVVSSGTTTQITTTTSGSSGQPRISQDGSWAVFTTNSEMFEPDPDLPFHLARINLSSLEIERIGARQSGAPLAARPSQDASVVSFMHSENPIEQNWDVQPEIFVARPNVVVDDITFSDPAPTTISWKWKSGAMRYDVIRGDATNIAAGPGSTVDLGPVVCIEDNSLNVDTIGDEDVDPVPGGMFFYIWRSSEGLNAGPGSYGESTGGDERVAASGDCTG